MLTDLELHYLYQTLDAKLLWRGGGWALVAGPGGLTFLAADEFDDPRPADVDPFEPFDEAFFLPGLGRFVFAGYDGTEVTLRVARPSEAARLVGEGTVHVAVPVPVGELQTDGDSLVGVGPTQDTRLRITPRRDDGGWAAHVAVEPSASGPGDPVGTCGLGQVLREDRTPYPPVLRLHDRAGTEIVAWTSHTWTHTATHLLWAEQRDEQYGITVYGAAGQRFVPSPGYVRSLAADSAGRVCAVVYRDGEEMLYRVSFSGDGEVAFVPLGAGTGRKILSPTADGMAVLTWDHRAGVSACWPEGTDGRPGRAEPLGRWSYQEARITHHRSPLGARAFVIDPAVSEAGPTVVHLHGGPESYEVPELRCFGALRELAGSGVRVVGLNYRGSLAIDPTATTDAWQRWHITFPEDLDWVVDAGLAVPPILMIGWSFGGTLAIRAASLRSGIAGVVAGAAMTDLSLHRVRAAGEDDRYVTWFAERFGPPDGPCEDFFQLARHLDQPCPVLTFHGKDDPHCSYDDLQDLIQTARASGYAWQHGDMPGGEHRIVEFDDVRLIHRHTIDFARNVLGLPR
jgi:dipeptidyl aminopeptidase/acylaminoacyl peptidase